MDLWLDGKQMNPVPPGANLMEILGSVVAEIGGQSTMKEVRVNGTPYSESQMGPAGELLRDRIQSLEVETMPNRQVAAHFLANAGHFIQTISQALGKVAEMFRVNDEREASEQYLRSLDSLQLFLQVLAMSREVLGLDFDTIVHQGQSLEKRMETLSALVQEMLSAQQREDWVLLADLMQYDLIAELAVWQEVMPALAQRASS